MKTFKRKNVTEKEFNSLKLLVQAGLTQAQVKSITGRSHIVYNFVKQASDFETYVLLNKERSRKIAGKNVTPVSVDPPSTVVINTELSLVLNKLQSLEDCMYELLNIFKDKEAKANVAFWKR